jgi:Protein of unknown function (DUF2934)
MTQASFESAVRKSSTKPGEPSQHDANKTLQSQIQDRAYALYEQRGRSDGHDWEDWIQAEQEVRDKYGLGKAA